MGKRIISRARGAGGPRYRSPGHRFAGRPRYNFDSGEVIDIIHDPGRDNPLAKIRTVDGRNSLIVAAEGLKVGDTLDVKGEPKTGNILPLGQIPKGSFIFAIESHPGSGPHFCMSSFATLISNEQNKIILKFPSRQFKTLDPRCLATIGIPAGSGRGDKPFVKAGQVYYLKRARNKLWPRTSAVKMNPVDHPFGGHTKPGMSKSISRNAPPGAKVGSIASRRTGRKKK